MAIIISVAFLPLMDKYFVVKTKLKYCFAKSTGNKMVEPEEREELIMEEEGRSSVLCLEAAGKVTSCSICCSRKYGDT